MFERHLCSFVERLVAFAILQLARGSYYVSDLIPSNMFLSVMHRQKKKKSGAMEPRKIWECVHLKLYVYVFDSICVSVCE